MGKFNLLKMRHRTSRLLLLCLLVVLGVIFTAIGALDFETNFESMFETRKAMVDMICDDFEEDIAAWQDYDETKALYIESLISDAEGIDKRPHTLGILYDRDMRMLSQRVAEVGIPYDQQYVYDPKVSPAFIAYVKAHDSGTYETDSEYGRIRLYFRWIPAGGSEFVMVAGISENAVAHSSPYVRLLYIAILMVCAMIPIIDAARDSRECDQCGRM